MGPLNLRELPRDIRTAPSSSSTESRSLRSAFEEGTINGEAALGVVRAVLSDVLAGSLSRLQDRADLAVGSGLAGAHRDGFDRAQGTGDPSTDEGFVNAAFSPGVGRTPGEQYDEEMGPDWGDDVDRHRLPRTYDPMPGTAFGDEVEVPGTEDRMPNFNNPGGMSDQEKEEELAELRERREQAEAEQRKEAIQDFQDRGFSVDSAEHITDSKIDGDRRTADEIASDELGVDDDDFTKSTRDSSSNRDDGESSAESRADRGSRGRGGTGTDNDGDYNNDDSGI